MCYGHSKCQGILVKLKVIVRVMGRGRGRGRGQLGQEQGQSQGPSPESMFGSNWHAVSGPDPHSDWNAWCPVWIWFWFAVRSGSTYRSDKGQVLKFKVGHGQMSSKIKIGLWIRSGSRSKSSPSTEVVYCNDHTVLRRMKIQRSCVCCSLKMRQRSET